MAAVSSNQSIAGASTRSAGKNNQNFGNRTYVKSNARNIVIVGDTGIARHGVLSDTTATDLDDGSLQLLAGRSLFNCEYPGEGLAVHVGARAHGLGPEGWVSSHRHLGDGSGYATTFQWADYNEEKQDRVGQFVKLGVMPEDADKIYLAENNDEAIGITTDIPAFVENSGQLPWEFVNEKDQYGRSLKVPSLIEALDKRRRTITFEIQRTEIEQVYDEYIKTIVSGYKPIEEQRSILVGIADKLNLSAETKAFLQNIEPLMVNQVKEEYMNDRKVYYPRSLDYSFANVGIMGKLIIEDNGLCVPGTKCGINSTIPGKAAPADDIVRGRWHVLRRVSDFTIEILFK